MFRSIGRLLSTELAQSLDMLLPCHSFQSIYMLQSAAEFQSRHLLHFSIVVSFIAYVTNHKLRFIHWPRYKSLLKIQSVVTTLLSSGDSIKCYDTICRRASFGIFVTIHWVDSFCPNDTNSWPNSIPGYVTITVTCFNPLVCYYWSRCFNPCEGYCHG